MSHVHANSIAAYYEGNSDAFNRRETEILRVLGKLGRATDRAIRDALGFPDMNAVRPRITELIECGVLHSPANTVDPVTGRTVRLVSIVSPEPVQLSINDVLQ